jgi:biotin carboxylase
MRANRARNVLLCDAAFSSLPILFALKKRGYRVAVCGSRPNDPGHAVADLSFPVDYSDEQSLVQLVRNNSIDFIVPGCTDVSYLSSSKVAYELGAPGFDTPESIRIIHKKDAFRKFCSERGFPIPRFASDVSELRNLRFPILVKPSDSFSGKGIVKVESFDEVSRGIAEATSYSSTRSIVFEEFIDGSLYSHSAILRNGKIEFDVFVNEYCTVNPYQVNSSHVSVNLPDRIVSGLRDWLGDFARELWLADGLVHTQFIVSGDAFYLIEVTRRCPGDLYAVLVERSIGIDYAFAYASSFCQEDVSSVPEKDEARCYYSRHTVSVNEDCVFLSAGFTLPVSTVSYVPLKRTGEILRAAPMDRAGIYFIEHDCATAMTQLTPALREYVTLQTG